MSHSASQVRVSQTVHLKPAKDGTAIFATGERFVQFRALPRKGDPITFAGVDASSNESTDVTTFVNMVHYEIWRSGEVHVTLVMDPRVVTNYEDFEKALGRLQNAGFQLDLEADE